MSKTSCIFSIEGVSNKLLHLTSKVQGSIPHFRLKNTFAKCLILSLGFHIWH
jgi:hypothetical protein